MSDTPTPTPPGAPASTKRPWTFLGRIARALREQNWAAVAVEIVIVVLGVVIGFQVTTWGQGRADRAKEQVYLRQLAADLRETERLMAEADSVMWPANLAVTALVRSFRTAERPPVDSVAAWLTAVTITVDPRPVLGTAQALVSTGDLALIRDDSLRTAVTAYLDDTRRASDILAANRFELPSITADLIAHADIGEALVLARPSAQLDSLARAGPLATIPEGPLRRPFPLDAEALLEDQAFYSVIYRFYINHLISRLRKEEMREGARSLREGVEAVLDS